MFKKIKKPAACEMRSVIHFLNARNIKLADIHCQLRKVYGEHAMSDSMVRRWVRHFNEGRKNVHDDPQSGWLSVVNEDLVRAVEEKIQEDDSPLLHFPCIFHKFQDHFFTKLCLINFVFRNCVHVGCRRCLQKNTKWNGRPVPWPFWHDTVSKVMTSWAAVTGDKKRVSHVTLELEQQTMEWRHTWSPIKKNFKQTISTRKIMCTVFWDRKRVLLVEFLPQGSTINTGSTATHEIASCNPEQTMWHV
jgi:hypothetical protein